MGPSSATKSSSLFALEAMLKRVGARMEELGLSLSVWDDQAQPAGPLTPTHEFCALAGCRDGLCAGEAAAVAQRVIAEGEPVWSQEPGGCCVMGVPIRQRRRLIGAAVACYPSRQMLEEERLARLCDARQLDRQVVEDLGRELCRHDADEADDLLRVLQWLLEGEQALHVAGAELVTLSTNLSTTYEELSLLYTISGSMKVTQHARDFVRGVCAELLEVMNISAAAAIVYAHPPAAEEDLVVISGELGLSADQVKLLAATQIAPLLAKTRRSIVENRFVWRERSDLGQAVRNLVAVPLAGEESLGVLMAINKVGDFNSIDLKLMGSIGSQSAVFLQNNMLYADLQDLLMGVLHALTATIDAKDPYTCGHSRRVALLSKRLAEECGLPASKVEQIYLAGLLHDIGKIGVPESTLCKPGRLNAEEYEEIKKHPGIGAKILGGIRQLDDLIAGILCHHERPDGRGYPQGLCGGELPAEGLIIGLADGFDAMTSDRIYRKALPLPEAIEEIRRNRGTQFDPALADKFLSIDLGALLEEMRRPPKTVFPVSLSHGGGR